MNIFEPFVSGNLSVSGSAEISGSLTVLGTINATISGTTSNALNAQKLNNQEASYYAITGSNSFKGDQQVSELERIRKAAQFGVSIGLRVNAGHGLHEGNVKPVAAITELSELNIGHAIVAEALFKGWQKAIVDMKALMVQGRAKS